MATDESYSTFGLRNRRGGGTQGDDGKSEWHIVGEDQRSNTEGSEASDTANSDVDDEGCVNVGGRDSGFGVLSDEDDIPSEEEEVKVMVPKAPVVPLKEDTQHDDFVGSSFGKVSGVGTVPEASPSLGDPSPPTQRSPGYSSLYSSKFLLAYCAASVAAAVVAVWTLPPKPEEVPVVVGHLEALERMVLGEDSDISSKINMDYLWSMVYPDYQPPTVQEKAPSSITSAMTGIFADVVASKPRLVVVAHAFLCVVYLIFETIVSLYRSA